MRRNTGERRKGNKKIGRRGEETSKGRSEADPE